MLQKPIGVLFPLHPTNYAPFPKSMADGKRYRFGAVLRDPVVIVLLYLIWAGSQPREHMSIHPSIQRNGQCHSRRVTISRQCKRGTSRHHQSHIDGQSWVHFS